MTGALCAAFPLTGAAEPSVFPISEVRVAGARARRVLAFAAAAAALALAAAGFLLKIPVGAVAALAAALVQNYLFVRNCIARRPDVLRIVSRCFLLLLALAGVWFLATRDMSVTTFAHTRRLPGLPCVRRGAAGGAQKGRSSPATRNTCCSDVALGLVPLALAAAGLTEQPAPSYASAAAAGALLLATVALARGELAAEIPIRISIAVRRLRGAARKDPSYPIKPRETSSHPKAPAHATATMTRTAAGTRRLRAGSMSMAAAPPSAPPRCPLTEMPGTSKV